VQNEKYEKKYRINGTLEFQNMNIKNLELAIKQELVTRNLIKNNPKKAGIFNQPPYSAQSIN
jgi:hypothetical protein